MDYRPSTVDFKLKQMRYLVGLILLLVVCGMIINCSPRNTRQFLTMNEVEQLVSDSANSGKSAATGSGNNCNDQLNYIPDAAHPEHHQLKLVRVNFHIMRRSNGRGNFTEAEGVKYCKDWLKHTNSHVIRNKEMHLPVGNNTPKLPINYRYVIAGDPNIPGDDGVYFHNDDELCYFVKTGKNKNNYKKEVIDKYIVQKGKVLNIFMMPHHPDSIASPAYSNTLTGIAFLREGAIKVAGNYFMYNNPTVRHGKPFNRGAWYCHGVLNHEIGHIMGLRHTWKGNDRCDDTPNHKNCYSQNRKRPECIDGWSNNVMDYNTHQNSWTPCQIGIVQRNIAKKGSVQRGIIAPTWCKFDPEQHIRIKDEVTWKGAKDLEGHLTIESGGKLTVQCRVSLPKKAKITVKSGAELVLDGATLENDCGDKWQGIVIEGEGNKRGKVVFLNEPVLTDMENEL